MTTKRKQVAWRRRAAQQIGDREGDPQPGRDAVPVEQHAGEGFSHRRQMAESSSPTAVEPLQGRRRPPPAVNAACKRCGFVRQSLSQRFLANFLSSTGKPHYTDWRSKTTPNPDEME